MSRWPRLASMVLATVAAAAAVVITAGPAAAHATLVGTNPEQGSILTNQPRSVRLTFDEPVEVTAGAVNIVGPDGNALPGLRPAIDPTNADIMVVNLPGSLPDGTYDVSWQILSIDGHPIRGEFEFAIGQPSSPLGQASSSAGGGPTLLGGAGRALAVAGALAMAGLAAFPLLVLVAARRRLTDVGPRLVDETCRRMHKPLIVAGAFTMVGTSSVLADTAAPTGALLEVATGTRTGQLLLVRLVAVLVTTMLLTLRTGGRIPTGPRLLAGLVAAVMTLLTFSLSSHAAAAAVDRPVAVIFDVAHLMAAGVWIGGLLGLALAGLPAARSVAGRDLDVMGISAAALFRSFSLTAQLAMLVVLVTGAYPALIQISATSDLGQTWWGVELTAKLALWVSVLLFAAARARRLAALDQLRSAVRVELAMAGGLILVAALMSATAQPTQVRKVEAAQAAFSIEHTATAKGESRGYVASVRVVRSGAEPGATTVFGVALTTEATLASAPSAEAVLTGADGIGRSLSLGLSSAGRWTSPGVDVSPGRYRLTLRFDRQDRPVIIAMAVTVPS
ncbi:MAG: copper resistance CopC family protein [Nocardioidaceae bacterium]